MSANLAILVALATLAGVVLWGALSTMCQEEIETRIGRVPDALIRLAAARLPREARDDVADEWRAELDFILRDTDGLPITRLLRGMGYAMSLLKVPPDSARELSFRVETVKIGYRGPTACHAAGITYNQLDYWARTGLIEPSVRAAVASGAHRLYSFRDILVLKLIKRLLDTGISLQQIRAAVQHLRDCGSEDLAQVTLMSDGMSVYECTSRDEVLDLLADGRGMFGIALNHLWLELAVDLAELPCVLGDSRGLDDESDHHGDRG